MNDVGDGDIAAVAAHCLGWHVVLPFALFFGTASAALAADLPAPLPSPTYPTPIYNWTGFYIGGNIGAAWSGLSGANFSDTLGSSFTAPTTVQFMGGGQAGVNYQFPTGVLIGAEVMFDGLPKNQSSQITATTPDGSSAAFVDAVNYQWLTTATGRVGYGWDRILLYAKGGGAWLAANTPGISSGGVSGTLTSSSTTDFGWTAGFGLEWAFWNSWSVRAEYDYIGLKSQSFTPAPTTPTFGGDVISFNNRNLSIFTAAINYKFGGW